MNNYLAMAEKISHDSSHPKHYLGAVVVKGGAILGHASNSARWKRHAEIRALKGIKNARGATLYVVRTNETGKMSRPCDNCMKRIKEAGISKVVYLDWDAQIVVEKV